MREFKSHTLRLRKVDRVVMWQLGKLLPPARVQRFNPSTFRLVKGLLMRTRTNPFLIAMMVVAVVVLLASVAGQIDNPFLEGLSVGIILAGSLAE